MMLWEKVNKTYYSGRNNINHISLTGSSSFPEYNETCTHTCVRYLRSHEEAYSQNTYLVKTLSVTVVIGGTLHTLKRYISYFICKQKYNRISPQKEGCKTFNGYVNVSLKEHLEVC